MCNAYFLLAQFGQDKNICYIKKSLCFVPIHDLEMVFDLLIDPAFLKQELWAFGTYVMTYYIGTQAHPARFSRERWNMYDE